MISSACGSPATGFKKGVWFIHYITAANRDFKKIVFYESMHLPYQSSVP